MEIAAKVFTYFLMGTSYGKMFAQREMRMGSGNSITMRKLHSLYRYRNIEKKYFKICTDKGTSAKPRRASHSETVETDQAFRLHKPRR